MTTKPSKPKFDRAAALAKTMADEKGDVSNRFGAAREVLRVRPGGLAVPSVSAPAPAQPPVAAPRSEPARAALPLRVGQTCDVPISLLHEPRRGARVFYKARDLDRMGQTFSKDGQEVPAKGYLEDGRVILIDGVTRLRTARIVGEQALRVEICDKPKDDRDLYLKSRRINLERSAQTVLDDAVRWKEMLEEGLFKDQEDVAHEVGRDQTQVSRILKINNIPMPLLHRMNEHEELCGYTVATTIARLFEGPRFEADPAGVEAMVDLMLDTIVAKKLSSRQVEDLVKSKLEGPRTRARNEARTVQYANVKGTIRVNEAAGNLSFEIKGLDAASVEKLRRKIEDLCAGAE